MATSHPRFSSSSLASDRPSTPGTAPSTRFSLSSTTLSTAATPPSAFPPVNVAGLPAGAATPRPFNSALRPNIYDRPLNKTRAVDVSGAAFALLFAEAVQYAQRRVAGINELERRLNTLGYRCGQRLFELLALRAEGSSKAPRRETRLLPALMAVHTQVWRAAFGKAADAIEKSVERDDEYMIIDNDPPIERYISVPRDLSTLSCSSFSAGIVEAVLDGLGFPARVTAHNTATPQFPHRTTILIKLERSVLEREELLK